jgi:hypothetical protein
VLLSKGELDKTAWHLAEYYGHVEIIQNLWDLSKELQLTPEHLKNGLLLLSKGELD